MRLIVKNCIKQFIRNALKVLKPNLSAKVGGGDECSDADLVEAVLQLIGLVRRVDHRADEPRERARELQ